MHGVQLRPSGLSDILRDKRSHAARECKKRGTRELADASYIVEGWLARGDQRMTLTDPALILADGILCTHTHAARVNGRGDAARGARAGSVQQPGA